VSDCEGVIQDYHKTPNCTGYWRVWGYHDRSTVFFCTVCHVRVEVTADNRAVTLLSLIADNTDHMEATCATIQKGNQDD